MKPKAARATKEVCRAARPSLRKMSAAYEAETIALWERRCGRRLSREDAREIVENIAGFFQVLQEWDRAERAACGAKKD